MISPPRFFETKGERHTVIVQDQKSDLYQSIVNDHNVALAYLEVAERLELASKSIRTRGIDCSTLRDIEPHAGRAVEQALEELELLVPCRPAVESVIPKDDGTPRRIFTYSLIDRIKARAIERQLLPHFEASYNAGLYSYRTGRSAQDAARQVIRRYRRQSTRKNAPDFIARTDVEAYTDHLDHHVLRNRLNTLFSDERVLELTDLFVGNAIICGRKVVRPERGLVQGVGLIAQFANVYLSDIDDQISRLVTMYRRVGDDFFLADPSRERLRFAWESLQERIMEHKLMLRIEKSQVGSAAKDFDYLGYAFHDGSVRIKERSLDKLRSYFRARLRWVPLPEHRRVDALHRILRANAWELHRKCVDFVFAYRFADCEQQLKLLSQQLFADVTRFFYRHYSPANQSAAKRRSSHLPIVSLPKIHYLITHGKASYKSLAVPHPFASSA